MNEQDIIDLDKFSGKMFDDFAKDVENLPRRAEKSKAKIPVVILSGFLGSGKTTLLNNILRDNHGMKIGAIINDFGQINIDSKLVAGSVSEDTIELSNGCICCILGDNPLSEPLEQLANNDSPVDAIVIEASGIAEPYDLLQTLRFSGNQYTEFGGNIYLIDGKNFTENYKQFPRHFDKCIKTSDIILITKTDNLTEAEYKTLETQITAIAKHSPVIRLKQGEAPSDLLFSNPAQNTEKQSNIFDQPDGDHAHDHEHCDHSHGHCAHHDDHSDHLHHQFSSFSFESKAPLEPKKLIEFLDNLPQNLFRAKGFCYFGMKGYEQKFTLQLVGNYTEIKAEEWGEETPKTELVLIGHNMDEAAALKQLQRAIDTNPNDIKPEDMMSFERFLTS